MPAKKTTWKKTPSSNNVSAAKAKPATHPQHHVIEDMEHMVEEKVHRILESVNKDRAEHVFHDFLGAFKGAEWQDYLMFILWVFFLIWALIELWAFVWGVILLLLALLLLNMFFGRK